MSQHDYEIISLMIATLEGIVSEKLLETLVLNVSGVGYGLVVTHEDYSKVEINENAKFYIYEHIRENMFDLYGFMSPEVKSLFELLLSVNGVGPRMAINMLSIGNAGSLKKAIAGGEVKYIQRASGIGKRVAERVVVDLKDKVGLASVNLDETSILQADSNLMDDEAVQALVSLGFTVQDAAKALNGVDDSLPTSERVKQALRTNK